jgi:hypothetical protein
MHSVKLVARASLEPSAADARSIAILSEPDRRTLALRWMDRASNELLTSTVFAELYRNLVALGAPAPILSVAASAIADELNHAELCQAIADHYGDRGDLPLRHQVSEPVAFVGCNARETALLHVILHSCLNEGIAVAYIQECKQQARATFVRKALHQILKDEVQHARIGWGVLSWSSSSQRAMIAEALPELVRTVRRLWEASLPGDQANPVKGHGCLSLPEIVTLSRNTLCDLLLPGFAHLGIDIRQAQIALD